MRTWNLDQWRVLSPRLDEALAMGPEERALWFAALQGKNPELAAQVSSLLNEHLELTEARFLEKNSFELPGLAGQTVGAYTLISQIGQGGMGNVWLAERTDGRFERRVAVKLLNIALMGNIGGERFKREGAILGGLAHPNIAQLIDAGVSAAGQPYLVLEHVEGDHIDRYCDGQALPVAARLRLFLDVLAAVAKAHASLIVHRDLKPSNVLVRNDRRAKLLDFGIAKWLDAEGQLGAPTRLTVEGGQAMTPEYAAPEQLTGDAVTTATDVYALGVLLFVLLTGQHPAGEGPHTPVDLVKAIVDSEAPRVSDVALSVRMDDEILRANAASRGTTPDKLQRMLRGDLDTIVAKALKKDPGERYSSVTALADDLRRYLKYQPITARPDTITYRATKFVRRNRTAVALAALAITATLGGVVGTVIETQRARGQRDFALGQVERTEALNEFHGFLLSDAAPSGKPFTVNELLKRAEQLVERQRTSNDPNRVVLLIAIGRQYVEQDEETAARRVLEEAYKLSRGLSDPSIRAEASCTLAASLARTEDLPRAEGLYQEGIRELPQGPEFTVQRIDCLQSGSEIVQETGDIAEGILRAETAQRVLRQSPFDSDVMEVHRWTDLAKVYSAAGKDAESVAAYERADELLARLGREDTNASVTLLNNWALQLFQMGHPLEAERLYRRGIEISKGSHAEEGISPVIMSNYARCLRELGRVAEAASYAERSYNKAKRTGMEVNHVLMERARIYNAQGNPKRAAAMLAEVEPRLQKSLPPGHFAFAVLALERSRTALARGDVAAAMKYADEAVAIDEAAIKAGKEGNYYMPALLVERSEVKLQAHQVESAIADASKALDLLRVNAKPGAYSSMQGKAFLSLGNALRAQGRREEARNAFRLAAENLRESVGAQHPNTRTAQQLANS